MGPERVGVGVAMLVVGSIVVGVVATPTQASEVSQREARKLVI